MLNILTLHWNNYDKILKLRDSLLPSLSDINYNWFIKDNASQDNSFNLIKEWKFNGKVFNYKDNKQNFSEGMNHLFNEASSNDEDYVLLLNNDIVFNDNNSIKNMISLMKKDNDIGIVGGRLLYNNTNKLQHAGVVFHEVNGMPLHFRANEESDKLAEENREFQAVTGAVMLTKAKYYKNICTTNKSGISGLNEKMIWAFDDIDACLSIKYNQNKKVVYCGKTNISHEESASLKKNPVNKLFMEQNSRILKSTWRGRYIIDRVIYNKDPRHNLYK